MNVMTRSIFIVPRSGAVTQPGCTPPPARSRDLSLSAITGGLGGLCQRESAVRDHLPQRVDFEAYLICPHPLKLQCQRLPRSDDALEFDRAERALIETLSGQTRDRVQSLIEQHDPGHDGHVRKMANECGVV